MWIYEQTSGWLIDPKGKRISQGYSGKSLGKNMPSYQEVHNAGPIPQGLYDLDTPIDTVTHGPYVIPLRPHPDNEMFGRGGFLIHGDSIVAPGTASEGCIIQPRFARELAWKSGDHTLRVIAQAP